MNETKTRSINRLSDALKRRWQRGKMAVTITFLSPPFFPHHLRFFISLAESRLKKGCGLVSRGRGSEIPTTKAREVPQKKSTFEIAEGRRALLSYKEVILPSPGLRRPVEPHRNRDITDLRRHLSWRRWGLWITESPSVSSAGSSCHKVFRFFFAFVSSKRDNFYQCLWNQWAGEIISCFLFHLSWIFHR